MRSEPSVTADDTVGSVPKIRVIFMGTPEFSGGIFIGLVVAGYDVVAAYTRPDKPSGRKREIVPSAVKRIAEMSGIPIEQPARFDDEALARLRSYRPDLIVVAAYGKILPKAVLSLPGFGCLNVHASLLPRWRGASPVQNALLAGDTETGVTVMLMDEGVDTGPILARDAFAIAEDDNAEMLLTRMAATGTRLLIDTIPRWIEKRIIPEEQDGSIATLCELIEREDGHIYWNADAVSIFNRYRGLYPWPGIFTFWKLDTGLLRLKLTRISAFHPDTGTPRKYGEVFETNGKIVVQTGNGLISIEEIQPEGKAPMKIRDFLNGRPGFIGAILG